MSSWKLKSGTNPLEIVDHRNSGDPVSVLIEHTNKGDNGKDKIKVSHSITGPDGSHFYLGVGQSKSISAKHVILEGEGSYQAGEKHWNSGSYTIK